MTKIDLILKELTQLRLDTSVALKHVEALEASNAQLALQVQQLTEKVDAQATYTAMMNDTLLEV